MTSPVMLKFFRRPAISSSALARILSQLAITGVSNKGLLSRVETEFVFYVEVSEPLTESQMTALVWLLSETFEPENFSLSSFLVTDETNSGNTNSTSRDSSPTIVEVGPRPSFTSAFSTNAVAVCRSCGVPAMRIERFRRFRLFTTLEGNNEGDEEDAPDAIADAFAAVAHDRMTEYRLRVPISSFKIDSSPEPVRVIPLLTGGKALLEEMNKSMGLSLDARDIDYILALFRDDLKRDPTDVELFDFSQSNSEHSRHWFFRGILDIDGERIPYTLMDLVKSTLDAKPHNSVIAFADNSSAIRGFPTRLLTPSKPGHPCSLSITNTERHLLLTAETHNFPTGIAPFPGAETGTGGRIRDSHATGRGSYPIAASAGYCVGNLRLPGYSLPWENNSFSYPDNMASPLQIEIDASNGASDYGNKFGEPVVLGFTRSFGLELSNGDRREYIKPIMFTAGIGAIDDNHLIKGDAKESMVVVKLGGPAYRIGMGGSAASSMLQGDNKADLDFNAVQRGDAQMEHKVNRVIRACCELGAANPIVSIHDQGAGGNCNVLKEIISPAGGRIDIRKVISGDASLSVLELWGAEYQESDALLISAESTALFTALCERERVPVAYVGVVTGDGDVRLEDSAATPGSPLPVNLPLEKVLGKMPPKVFIDKRAAPSAVSSSAISAIGKITAADALDRVLRLISVGSKRFLTNKVDRAVTGLIMQQQCVGPLHTPLADFAVVATSYFDKVGIASTIGEQPVKGLLNPSAMARLAVAEAITNMVGVKISSLSDAKCSANWMWAAKLPSEGAALFDAAKSMADFMIAVGVAIDGGKDSLSMAAKTPEGKTVKAPGTLVISLYAPCPDVENKRTPDIKHPGSSSLILIRPVVDASVSLRLGGSAFLQVFGHIGDGTESEAVPDCESPNLLVSAFEVTQTLLDAKKMLLSVHDISDGGLLTTVLEMAFAGNCGIDVCLPGSISEPLPALFAEEVGFVLEVPNGQEEQVLKTYADKGVFAIRLGSTLESPDVKVRVGNTVSSVEVLSADMRDLRDVWESTSFELERRQSNSKCVVQEQKGMRTRKTPPFSLSFSPRKPDELILLRSPESKPRLAVLREEGSNGDREMSAAFFSVGFDVHDITMSDLIAGRAVIDSSFRGIAFPGGFSYADVLDSAKGWAGTVRFNSRVLEQLKAFYARGDTFSIGVCNGCQLLSLLGWVPFGPDALPPTEQPRFIHNASGRFESRYATVRIAESPSIMLKGMAGSMMGIQIQHGEGRLHFPAPLVREAVECEKLAPLRYVDDDGHDTETYPFNPNGSGGGIAALCTRDGRHLAMMPHPERSFQRRQLPFLPRHALEGEQAIDESPWSKMFANAFEWCSGSPGSPGGSARAAATAFDNNFTVVVRVRPPLPRELEGGAYVNTVKVGSEGAEAAAAASAASIAAGGSPAEAAAAAAIAGDEKTIIISENLAALEEGAVGLYSTHTFTFDYVYGQHCDQRKVYETTAKAVVESSLKGYNATIFAYGQTGTGKTYTMEGFNSNDERGIIPRAIEQIFRHIQTSVSPRMRFLVRASYLQIYNEVISDLLKPERSNLLIREDKKKGVFVEGLSEWVVRSPAEIYGLMERGGAMRATGSTKMNELSSRSHAVFIIIAEQSETTYLDEAGNEMSVEEFHRLVKSRAHGENGLKALEANVRQSFKVGKLNLVDLAGSERVRLTGATGQRLEESKKINQSLSALGNVIAALTDPRGRQHIPYRDSKLTRILEDSLGGNCKTTMMAMISPALEAFVESLSTLKFANRAKNIKNEARINEDLDQKSLLRRYERELKRLRAELEERSRNVVDQRRLLEMDEQRRRAEEDKMAAIRALEARSKEFMREKQEKKRLEERITMLQSQVIMGGADKTNIGNWQEVPAFRNALKEHQERIRAEYDSRLAELEKERETIEEEKAQVDRYKQLLLKQRDIMILLTQRLNERDEQIMALQDELDAYDRHQRELEEKLDEKTAALIHLQRVTMEQDAVSPVRSSELAAALGAWAADRPAGGRLEGAASVASALSFGADGSRSATSPGGAGAAPHAPSAAAVAELTRTMETLRSDRDRLARELEDVQSEKVSMEFLLRERLEKLVQTEIEARLKSRGGDAPALEAQVQRYQHEAEQAKTDLANARADAETNAQRLVVLEKERVAISAILEGKIAKLVDSIAAASAGTPTRELVALQRLVHASVSALKQQS